MDTEKSEITKLPEGMSSEELDILTTGENEDADLAQEALDATETESSESADDAGDEEAVETGETEEKPEEKPDEDVDPKDAVIGDFRRKLRDSEIEKARLEGELEARKDLVTPKTEAPKSPLEIAEAAYLEENESMQGFTMSGELYREQKAFEEKQAAKQAAAESQEQSSSALMNAAEELQEDELSEAKKGKGLDLQSISNLGDKHLTRGDRYDLADIKARKGSKAALREAYKIMVRRTLDAGGDDAKALKLAVSTKKVKKSQTKPKKKPTNIDALTTEGEDEETGEAETETLNERLTSFICD